MQEPSSVGIQASYTIRNMDNGIKFIVYDG